MVNALVPSDRPAATRLNLPHIPITSDFSLSKSSNLEPNTQFSPSVVSVGAAIHSANVSHVYSTFCQRGKFRDFMDAWLGGHRRASPSFAVVMSFAWKFSCRGLVSLLDVWLTHSPGQRVDP